MSEKKRIYCFDSSAFIRLHQFYPENLFPDMWEIIETLFNTNQIVSHILVYNELNPDPKSTDKLGKLIKKKKKYFYDFTQEQIVHAEKIIKLFPKLIDPNNEKDQADPWLIAQAIELATQPNMFDDSEYYVVSEESVKSAFRIPAVCRHFKVEHLTLLEFYQYYKERKKTIANTGIANSGAGR